MSKLVRPLVLQYGQGRTGQGRSHVGAHVLCDSHRISNSEQQSMPGVHMCAGHHVQQQKALVCYKGLLGFESLADQWSECGALVLGLAGICKP